MRTLTPEEVKKLGLTPNEKVILLKKDKGTVFFASNVKGSCEEMLERMDENKHPEFPNLELAQQP